MTGSRTPDERPAHPPWPAVSVVMPVLNEARHLRSAVEHVLHQDYPGEIEVIIALGPSHDGTDRIAADIVASDRRVRCVPNPSGCTPSALNAAISAAGHDIVARVDGHGILPGSYLRAAVEVLTETGADNVGGIMHAEGTDAFERAVACAMTSPLGVGKARFHTGGTAGPADTVYLGVFRRQTLVQLGGYDESFQRAQDWELNYRIRAAGGLVWFSPRLRVSYRPRPTVGALARQYFHYGRWRRVVIRQHPSSANLRYLAPPAALVGAIAGCLVALFGQPLGWVLPGGYLAGILSGAAWEGRLLDWPARVRLPLVLATMHGSWAMGFLTSPRRLATTGPASRETQAKVS
ncbi:MAG: glycosyltransferase family 2 protein [Carbonactinosporaceae bacterium]